MGCEMEWWKPPKLNCHCFMHLSKTFVTSNKLYPWFTWFSKVINVAKVTFPFESELKNNAWYSPVHSCAGKSSLLWEHRRCIIAVTLWERFPHELVSGACIKSSQSYWRTGVRWQNVAYHQDHKRAPMSRNPQIHCFQKLQVCWVRS